MANITVTPQGNIYLCKTKLENDYKNQLTFTNVTAQSNYFSSTIQHTYSNYTYVKKDNYIQVSDNIDSIIDCNYLFYVNTGFTSKKYYCFISRMEYINENCTRIYFETDVFQTWQFQIDYKQSFVEREHVNDDRIGLHTVPEGLETGPYVCNGYDNIEKLCTNLKIVMGSTEAPSGEGSFIGGVYNGIYSGVKYYTYSAENTTTVIQSLVNRGKGDALSSLFLAPEFIVPTPGGGVVSETGGPINFSKSITKQSVIDNYTPRNKKLLTNPYCYLMVTNGNGGSVTYQQELFTTNNCGFTIMGALTPGCSIRIVPNYYKNTFDSMGNFFDEGLNLGKYPQLNWATDMYTNWLTQTAVNTITDIGKSAIGGALVGGVGGAIASGGATALKEITNNIGQSYLHDRIPPQTNGNINCGDVVTGSHNNTFHFYKMSIKREYAEIIDKYFDMFGYKINLVKVPNITGRTNWNYVKTINCNFEGDIPQTDLQIIRRIFDNGITLWHNPTTMLNYSNTNNIIS